MLNIIWTVFKAFDKRETAKKVVFFLNRGKEEINNNDCQRVH